MKTIADLRQSARLSQRQVADALDLKSVTTVANWERGLHDPTAKQLRGLAILFDVSCQDIQLPTEVGKIRTPRGRPRKDAAAAGREPDAKGE